MGARGKRDENQMGYVPAHNPRFEVRNSEKGTVQILVPRTGPFEAIVRVFKKTPSTPLTVDLDGFGSFVWRQIDGERDVGEIGRLLLAEYGEEIEPVHERLGKFLNLLKSNDFIIYRHEE